MLTALIHTQIHVLYLKLCGKYYLVSVGTQRIVYTVAHLIDQNRSRRCGNQITCQYFVGQIKQAPPPIIAPVYSDGSRGAPPSPPLILVKKEGIREGQKEGRVSKQN